MKVGLEERFYQSMIDKKNTKSMSQFQASNQKEYASVYAKKTD